MDESTHGVVLFSFGTLVSIEALPINVLSSIISIFAKLAPMRVLIKTKQDSKFPIKLPNNVIAMTWIPQIPILSRQKKILLNTIISTNKFSQENIF